MKKYTSGAFVSTTYGIYKSAQETITSFPAEIIGNEGNITPWMIYGNLTQSNACGERTVNLFDKDQSSTIGFMREDGTINENNNYSISDYIELLPNTQYTVSNMNLDGIYPAICFYTDDKTFISGSKYNGATLFTFTTPSNCKYVLVSYLLSLVNNVMLNTGSTALPYESYGYKIPVVIGSTSYPIYISEPLRKTLDGSNLYDTISSNGTLTRRADSSGDALATPTTELITVPTLPTSGSAETFNIDTTLKPSSVELTYTGWHRYDDKKAPWTTTKTRRKKKSV